MPNTRSREHANKILDEQDDDSSDASPHLEHDLYSSGFITRKLWMTGYSVGSIILLSPTLDMLQQFRLRSYALNVGADVLLSIL